MLTACGGGTSSTQQPTSAAPSSPATPAPSPSPLPPQASLPDWVNQLAIGQWVPIPNTAMASVAPTPTPDGITGPQSKVIAWTSFVVDTRTSKVYSVANGGHGDYSGNEVDVLDLENAAPMWKQLLPPTPSGSLTDCQSYYADGAPASRHTYYGVTLNEIDDRIMLFGGGIWCRVGGFHTAISSYSIGANAWSAPSTHGSVSAGFAGVAAYTRDPATDDVYASFNFNLGRWTRGSNTFTSLAPSGSGPLGERALSAFDTARGRILFVGEQVSRHFYTPSTNAWTRITLTGANAADVAIVSGASQAAMVYVPALDSYLVRLQDAGGAVYQIDAATFQVKTVATTGGLAIPATQNGPFNKFLYVPRLHGCIYVPSYSGNVWFLRLH